MLSTSASTYELTIWGDRASVPRLPQIEIEAHSLQPDVTRAPLVPDSGENGAMLNAALPAIIASAVAAYIASDCDAQLSGRTGASWADAEMRCDLYGSGPWPSGRAFWHQAERPR